MAGRPRAYGLCGGAICLALLSLSCAGNTRKHDVASIHGSALACAHRTGSINCVAFVDRLAHVRSIQLTGKIPHQVTASCAEAARSTRIEVICPPVVPVGGVIRDPSLYGPQIVNRRSYSISINNGQIAGYHHWEIGAIRGPAVNLWVFDRQNWEAAGPVKPAKRIGIRRLRGHLITLWRFPNSDGQLEGHDAAFATEHGISYFASIHGHQHDDGDIAMLIAILLARHTPTPALAPGRAGR